MEWYNPFEHYDKLYMAKVFSFTEDHHQYINNADCIEKGGTGYDIQKFLPELKNGLCMPIPSFDEILEANRDVLERIKEKGD